MNHDIGTTRSGLRLGYTTGSCAAGAAKAAARMLLGREEIRQIRLMTPKGIGLYLDLEEITRKDTYAECAVRKYSGDDPDVTGGMLVFARVEKTGGSDPAELRVVIEGGSGVGRVTRPGLEQAIGQAAINQVPRRMIRDGVLEMCEQYGYSGNIKVTVSVPGGEETAKKTFNPRLGIEGGLSILGTTGIVEPMSEKALTDTIYLEMKMIRESGSLRCFVTPGNYGSDFLQEELSADPRLCVKCSNYVGEAIDMAVSLGVKGILFVAHIGKFIKVAAGIMNTHSHSADGRMEVLAASAVRAGAGLELVREILECGTTDEALALLEQGGYLHRTMAVVLEKIQFYLDHRSYEQITLGAVIFSNVHGYLGQTRDAGYLIEKIRGTKGECCSQHQ